MKDKNAFLWHCSKATTSKFYGWWLLTNHEQTIYVVSSVWFPFALQFNFDLRWGFHMLTNWLQGNLNLLSELNVVLHKSAWGQKLVHWHSFFKPCYLYLVHSGGNSLRSQWPLCGCTFPLSNWQKFDFAQPPGHNKLYHIIFIWKCSYSSIILESSSRFDRFPVNFAKWEWVGDPDYFEMGVKLYI